MIIMLIVLVLGGFIAWAAFDDDELGCGLLVVFLMVISITLPCGASYSNYVDAKTFYTVTKNQYPQAIEMYEDKAVIKVADISLTDLKYQGYQESMASFIEDFRERVVSYNTTITKKRIYNNNLFFNWFIVMPDDDMKPISLIE